MMLKNMRCMRKTKHRNAGKLLRCQKGAQRILIAQHVLVTKRHRFGLPCKVVLAQQNLLIA